MLCLTPLKAPLRLLRGTEVAAQKLRLGGLGASARHLQRVGFTALEQVFTTPAAPDTHL